MKLGVNIDHVATLRQARKGFQPDVLMAAKICEQAGADSVVVHLREDRRHICDEDVWALKKIIKTKFNLEMSLAEDILEVACRVNPDQVTLVPEKRKELTTEGGLDVLANVKRIEAALKKLNKNSVEVSLFIDPEIKQIAAAKKIGINFIELHTGKFAEALNKKEQDFCLKQIVQAAEFACSKGITVFAGHGLNYSNACRIAQIKEIQELNIGHSIISRAVFVGLELAIRQMKELIK